MCDIICGVILYLENIDHIASIASSSVIVITALFGVNQFRLWKKEKRFESEFETALRIMKVTHKAQLLLDRIQTTEFSNDEYINAPDNLYKKGVVDIVTRKNNHVARAQILIDRLEGIVDCYDEIGEILHEAKSLFGDDNLHNILYDLSQCFIELSNIEEQVILNIDLGLVHNEQERLDKVKKVNEKINSSVDSVEKVIFPIIRYKKKS